METRLLGRTGHMSTLVIMGTAAFWEISEAHAVAALELMAARGVNHIDVAPQYGQAQIRLGPWLESRRDRFFLGCKTLERQRDAAWADLRNSLNVLRTAQVDLYQLHAITNMEELDAAFAPGGAIEVLKEARAQGLTRSLGITGHGLQSPATFIEALNRFDFDTIMIPINPALYGNDAYRRDMEQLLKMCAERNVGVQVIKAVARGPWGDKPKDFKMWYQPFSDAETINRWVRFALSQQAVTCLASPGDVLILPLVLEAAATFTPMDAAEQEALIEEARALEPLFV